MPGLQALQAFGIPGGALVVLLFMATVLAALVALSIWTYRDAQENSRQSPVLWAVLVFIAPVVGILLYLLLGREV